MVLNDGTPKYQQTVSTHSYKPRYRICIMKYGIHLFFSEMWSGTKIVEAMNLHRNYTKLTILVFTRLIQFVTISFKK